MFLVLWVPGDLDIVKAVPADNREGNDAHISAWIGQDTDPLIFILTSSIPDPVNRKLLLPH